MIPKKALLVAAVVAVD